VGPWGCFAWGGYTYFEYAYDKAGNCTRSLSGADLPWTYYEYAADNSLTRHFLDDLSAATYCEYDKTGAVEKIVAPDGTAYFEYAASGLVKKFAKAGKTLEFAYDGNLQRHAMVEDGVATYYVWDGLRLLETRNADHTLKARFTHGVAKIEGIGSGVEVYVPSSSKRYCMLMDHRGSVAAVLDESKTVVATRLYSAFGEIVSESGTWPAEVPFGYQSNWMYLDGLTLPDGSPLYLSPTRVYHAGAGRFLQRDLLRYINRYDYGRSSVLELVDAKGMEPGDADVPRPSPRPYSPPPREVPDLDRPTEPAPLPGVRLPGPTRRILPVYCPRVRFENRTPIQETLVPRTLRIQPFYSLDVERFGLGGAIRQVNEGQIASGLFDATVIVLSESIKQGVGEMVSFGAGALPSVGGQTVGGQMATATSMAEDTSLLARYLRWMGCKTMQEAMDEDREMNRILFDALRKQAAERRRTILEGGTGEDVSCPDDADRRRRCLGGGRQ
jgi:hypothetical protein